MFLSLSLGRRGGFRFWVKMPGKYVGSSEILPGLKGFCPRVFIVDRGGDRV